MRLLIWSFLKIFFRNPRAIFFVIFLPAGIFIILAFLGLEEILRFNLPVSYTNFLLSGIIAMALMQTGVYTIAYTLIDYRRTKIFERLAVTPLSASQFLLAQVLARFVVAILQVAVLLILGAALFHTTTRGLVFLPFLIFLGSTLFLNFGFLIAAAARDYEEAAPYTTLISLPLIFLGDVFFPVQNLPQSLASLAAFLPLKPLASLLRHFLLGINSENLGGDILVLLVWLLVLTLISRVIFAKKVYR